MEAAHALSSKLFVEVVLSCNNSKTKYKECARAQQAIAKLPHPPTTLLSMGSNRHNIPITKG